MVRLLFKPALSLVVMTLRAGTIAARVIGKNALGAVIALVDVASKERRPAVFDVVERAFLRGGQIVAKLLAVSSAMKADDIGHLQHEDQLGFTGRS